MTSDPPDAPDTAEQYGLDPGQVAALVAGRHDDPFALLGPHRVCTGWVVRCFVPGAARVDLHAEDGGRAAMAVVHTEGLFAVRLPQPPGRYSFEAVNAEATWRAIDPYQFGPVLGELDEHLIAEGAHLRLWRTLGARLCRHDGVDGTAFAVWAPNARRVSVVGPFNNWDGRCHPMRRRGSTGVWELFLPEIGPGTLYKYEIAAKGDRPPHLKADPVGLAAEMRPGTASVVAALNAHDWRDGAWMTTRGERHRTDRPISIYEVHLGSWRRHEDGSWLGYRELADTLVPYVADMGFTHIEVLPVSEHPLDASWGYQPVGLFAPTTRFGGLDDFRTFVEACHAAEIGLIIDWVPAHFPADAHGLGDFDGTPLYEHADPREGYHPDWNTLIYNFGRTEVQNYLIANALYWVLEHHVDGLRVDAVASMLYRDYSRQDGQWIPNRDGGRENLEAIAFLRRMNATVYGADPSLVTLAEESTAWAGVSRPVHEGGLGFGFKWNMGWMHDTLTYMSKDPVYRAHHHDEMTFGLLYAFSENFVLPLSHDEVVHGKGSLWAKMPGDPWAKLANLRAYYGFMWAHPGKKLLFMGQEVGQRHEWHHDAQVDWGVLGDPDHAGLQRLVRDLNGLYRDQPALHQRDARADGFQWIDGGAREACVFAWVRWGEEGAPPVLVVCNFSGVAHEAWRLGVPRAGRWREALNTDAAVYGGTDQGNRGGATAEAVASHGQPASLVLSLPALSALYFMHEG